MTYKGLSDYGSKPNLRKNKQKINIINLKTNSED